MIATLKELPAMVEEKLQFVLFSLMSIFAHVLIQLPSGFVVTLVANSPLPLSATQVKGNCLHLLELAFGLSNSHCRPLSRSPSTGCFPPMPQVWQLRLQLLGSSGCFNCSGWKLLFSPLWTVYWMGLPRCSTDITVSCYRKPWVCGSIMWLRSCANEPRWLWVTLSRMSTFATTC